MGGGGGGDGADDNVDAFDNGVGDGGENDGAASRGDFKHVLRYSYSSTTLLQAQDDAGAIIDAEFKIVPLPQRPRGHQLVVEWVEHRQIKGSGNIEKMDDADYSNWFSFTVSTHGEVQDCRFVEKCTQCDAQQSA